MIYAILLLLSKQLSRNALGYAPLLYRVVYREINSVSRSEKLFFFEVISFSEGLSKLCNPITKKITVAYQWF